MLVMWTAMAHAFGSSWVSQYGTSEESAFRSWSKALENYQPDQIKRGVKNSADSNVWDSHFPPNLNEFCKLCLTKRQTVSYHRRFLPEPEVKRSSPDRVQREFAKMRKAFPWAFRGNP